MNPAENYILNHPEPYRSTMLYIRSVILKTLPNVEEKYNYSISFYHYNKKPICYLNILKGTHCVDVAFVKGSILHEQFPELKDYNNRKFVRSLQYNSLENIDELLLISVINAAAEITDNNRKVRKEL